MMATVREKKTFDSGGKTIDVEVFKPAEEDKHPVIVVAYGTAGMEDHFGPDIRAFAEKLADNGYLVLIPHYFMRTSTLAGPAALEGFRGNRSPWIETLGHCLIHAAGRADAVADRMGLLGFSMGGHLALRLAKLDTGAKVAAVVDFFAPITMLPFEDLGDDIAKLPPVQIHHGEADGGSFQHPVSPEESRGLETLLKEAGKVKGRDFESKYYPGQGHGFTGAAVADSIQLTVEFFNKHLG